MTDYIQPRPILQFSLGPIFNIDFGHIVQALTFSIVFDVPTLYPYRVFPKIIKNNNADCYDISLYCLCPEKDIQQAILSIKKSVQDILIYYNTKNINVALAYKD